MKNKSKHHPFAYLITFRTYGTWLFGNPKPSVHHASNKIDTPKMGRNETLYRKMQESLKQEIIELNNTQRDVVLSAIITICKKQGWRLFAAHVRSNHVHLVLKTTEKPERAMTQIKACATRLLRKENVLKDDLKVWVRHGSTKYMWTAANLYSAVRYVVDEQGERMSCFYEEWYDNKDDLIVVI